MKCRFFDDPKRDGTYRDTMKVEELPKGWTEEQVLNIIKHYEVQTEDEAAAEDEATLGGR